MCPCPHPAFFVEDGSETGNTFIGNLGSLTMRAMSLLESDQTPSTFWITNPDNVFEDNVAAGGDAFGFWINLPRHPGGFLSFTGATFRDNIFPQHAMLGSFKRNTAHGYLTGLLAHDLDPKVFDPRRQVTRRRDGWSGQWFKQVDDDPGMRRAAKFEDVVTYSNQDSGGILQHIGHLAITGFVSARQPVGLETLTFVAEQWADESNGWNAPAITKSLFLGDGNSECGINGPMSDWLTISDTAFHGFSKAGGAAICACKLCRSGRKGGQELRTEKLRFSDMGASAKRVGFGHHFEGIVHDLDGSLTGTASGWMHGVSDDGTLGHFPPDNCATSSLGQTNNRPIAIVCDARVGLRTFRWRHVLPQETFEMRDAIVSTPYGQSVARWMVYDILIRRSSHHFTIVTRQGADIPHRVDWRGLMDYPTDHQGWSAGEVCDLREGESAIIEVPTNTDPHRWSFEGNEVAFPTATLGPLDTLASSRRLNGFWSYEPAAINASSSTTLSDGLLRMMVATRASGATSGFPEGTSAKPSCSSSDPRDCHEGQRCVNAKLTRFDCAPIGCFIDSDTCMGDTRIDLLSPATPLTHDWCTPNGTLWSVPGPGANVTIPVGTRVLLSNNCITSIVNRLDIFGELIFIDGTDSTLRATHIHVASETGRLEAGTHDSPFTSSARIELFGHRMTPPYPNSGLGSKFLVVFGELSLVGAPLPEATSLWSALQVSTESGDSVVTLPSSWATALALTSGDELLLAPSGLAWNESEVVTIAHCCNVSELLGDGFVEATLASPLLYDHRGLSNTTVLGTSQPFMAAEVALVSTGDARFLNVVVQGMDDAQGAISTQQFGASTYIMQRTKACPRLAGAPPEGTANVSGVAFRGCGQRGWDSRGCFNVRPQQREQHRGAGEVWDTGGRVRLSSSVILHGFSGGVLLDNVHGAAVDGNVVARTVGIGVRAHGQRNRITNNLISEVADAADSSTAAITFRQRWVSGRVQAIGIHHSGRGGVVSGNSVAGAEAVAMLTDGHECGATETITNNVVHSALAGVFYGQRDSAASGAADDGSDGVSTRSGYTVSSSTRTTCYELSDFQVHSTLLYGVHSGRLLVPQTRGATSSLVYNSFTLVDSGVALSHAAEGPDSTHHDKSRPDLHWKVVGATVLASGYRCRQVGFVAANFHNVNAPWGPIGIDMHGIRNAPSLYGGSVLLDSTFDGFGEAEASYAYDAKLQVTCTAGSRNVAITNDHPALELDSIIGEVGGDGLAGQNVDGSSPLTVSGISFGSSVDAASRYKLQPADQSYIGDQGCAQIDCDGRRNALILDLDGSLLSSAGTILGHNEIHFNDSLTYVDPTGAQTPADLLPTPMTVASDGSKLSRGDIFDFAGTSRHSSAGVCEWSSDAEAYECVGGQHRQLIVEDTSHTAMENRVAPVALVVDGYLSLATGPQNYAISYVTTTNRLNTFWLTGVLSRTHDVHFSSTTPSKLRLHLRDVSSSEWVLARVHYAGVPNRVDCYVAGAKIAATASASDVTSSSAHGTSFHDVDTTSLLVLLKGSAPVDLVVAPCVTLGLGLAVSASDFFATGRDGLVANIATLLGIPSSRIKVPGAAAASGRRLSESSSSEVLVVIEGGAPETLEDADASTVSSDLEQELALQSYAQEMEGVGGNLSKVVESGDVANAVEVATGAPPTLLNVTSVVVAIPGWTGEVSDYGTGNGCQCGKGLLDPDCATAPTPVAGCAALVGVPTTAATATETEDEEDEEEDDAMVEYEDAVSADNATSTDDLAFLTPTRTCVAVDSVAETSTAGTIVLTLGVCDYSLPYWSGSGSDFNAGDGVCDCARGLWDPDCDSVDFTNPELNASSFGCPSDGQRYLCYRETRACFTDLSGGLPQGVCLLASASAVPANCPAMDEALAAVSISPPPSLPPPSPPLVLDSPPPAPPLPEGKTLAPKLSFAVVASGTVDTFDKSAYAANLATLLDVDASLIELSVSAASVRVVATVTAGDMQAAQAMSSVLGGLNASTATAALGVSVATLEAPTIALVVVDAASPPPQSPAGASPPSAATEDNSLLVPLAAILGAVVVIGIILAGVAIVKPRRCFPNRVPLAPDQEKKVVVGSPKLPKKKGSPLGSPLPSPPTQHSSGIITPSFEEAQAGAPGHIRV